MDTVTDWKCWRDPTHDSISTTMFGWPQCDICRAAPAYHERPGYLPHDFVLGIYVPRDDRARTWIAPRSGVVGLHNGGDGDDARIQVYYEGWVNGWVNGAMQYEGRDARGLWEAGVHHAAGRMVTAYPTVAQAYLPVDTLQYIGLYVPSSRQITIDNFKAFAAWIGE